MPMHRSVGKQIGYIYIHILYMCVCMCVRLGPLGERSLGMYRWHLIGSYVSPCLGF